MGKTKQEGQEAPISKCKVSLGSHPIELCRLHQTPLSTGWRGSQMSDVQQWLGRRSR